MEGSNNVVELLSPFEARKGRGRKKVKGRGQRQTYGRNIRDILFLEGETSYC
jgi:hypothetical protein